MVLVRNAVASRLEEGITANAFTLPGLAVQTKPIAGKPDTYENTTPLFVVAWGSWLTEIAAKAAWTDGHTIYVFVVQKVETAEDDEIAPLVGLVEEAAKYLRTIDLPDEVGSEELEGGASITEVEIDPIVDDEFLVFNRIFLGVIAVKIEQTV